MPDDKQELKMTCPKCGQHVFCPACLEEVEGMPDDKQERSCENCFWDDFRKEDEPCASCGEELENWQPKDGGK